MLIVQEHIVKLGGVKLSGQCKSVDITESASIEEVQDDKGKKKAVQPTGYDAAKVVVEFILEDSGEKTQLEQLTEMQRLFKPYGQEKATLLKIYNEDCAARGISKVYFEKLSTKNTISESGRTATLELKAPQIAGIKLKDAGTAAAGTKKTKKSGSKKKSKKKSSKSPANKKKSAKSGKSKAKKLSEDRIAKKMEK